MQPSDKHSTEERRKRIAAAMAQGRAAQQEFERPGSVDWDPGLVSALAPGLEFVSTTEIRVVPKVQPRGRMAMLAALNKSVVFKAGTRFRILNTAACPRKSKSRYYRVAVIGPSGKTGHTGFIIESAIQGHVVKAA